MLTGCDRLGTDVFGPGLSLPLEQKLNSLTWRWCGSRRTLVAISNLFSISLCNQLTASIGAVIVESSPCTVKSSFCLSRKLHGDIRRDMKPKLFQKLCIPESNSALRLVFQRGSSPNGPPHRCLLAQSLRWACQCRQPSVTVRRRKLA